MEGTNRARPGIERACGREGWVSLGLLTGGKVLELVKGHFRARSAQLELSSAPRSLFFMGAAKSDD